MPQGGTLSFDVELKSKEARIIVADTGTGIPESERERISSSILRPRRMARVSGWRWFIARCNFMAVALK